MLTTTLMKWSALNFWTVLNARLVIVNTLSEIMPSVCCTKVCDLEHTC